MVEEGDKCLECKMGTMQATGYVRNKGRMNTETFQGWEAEREYQCDNPACGKKRRSVQRSFSIDAIIGK